MSRIGIYSVNYGFNDKNAIFERPIYGISDDLGAPFRLLKRKIENMGHSINTLDMISFDLFDGFLFLDVPDKKDMFFKKAFQSGKPLFLLIFECEIIKKRNWDPEIHALFDVIFTWSPDLCTEKYIRYYWPNMIKSSDLPVAEPEKEKLCVMMAGNKWKSHARELYSERISAIEWFMKNHPDEFDLYGPGWSVSEFTKFRRSTQNFLRYFSGFRRRPNPWKEIPFYKGTVESKRKTLSRYRFSICYENAQGIPGYITEKIFDCFLAGVVPIYLGWKDVDRFIPGETFIDKRRFSTYEDLYDFISNMAYAEYEGFLKAARDFLASEAARKFDGDTFVDTIIEGMGLSNQANLEGGLL